MQQQVNITLDQLPAIKCECGNTTFSQVFQLRRVSALLSQTGQESIFQIPVFECSVCGEILPETLPKETPSEPESQLILPENE